MNEIDRFYNIMTEGINNPEDMILRINDLLKVYTLLVSKILEIEKDNSKRSMICDSIKAMNNNMIIEVMKIVAEAEVNTIENDK